MADATAQLSNYRQSPRKVGLIAGLVRGKRVAEALMALDAMPKRGADPIAKLIRSAVASAAARGASQDSLVISKIEVGKGVVFKRSMPRARGSMSLIRKKSSHIKLELSAVARKTKVKKTARKSAPKEQTAAPEVSADNQ